MSNLTQFTMDDCENRVNGMKVLRNPNCSAKDCFGRGYIGTDKEGNPIQCPKCVHWVRAHYNILLENRYNRDMKIIPTYERS